jgi:hypothetical protein
MAKAKKPEKKGKLPPWMKEEEKEMPMMKKKGKAATKKGKC